MMINQTQAMELMKVNGIPAKHREGLLVGLPYETKSYQHGSKKYGYTTVGYYFNESEVLERIKNFVPPVVEVTDEIKEGDKVVLTQDEFKLVHIGSAISTRWEYTEEIEIKAGEKAKVIKIINNKIYGLLAKIELENRNPILVRIEKLQKKNWRRSSK